jgi:hypothetical protein
VSRHHPHVPAHVLRELDVGVRVATLEAELREDEEAGEDGAEERRDEAAAVVKEGL